MDDWGDRVEAVWDDGTLSDSDRIEMIDALAAERPTSDGRALLERAGARDAAGIESEAAPLYRAALEAGLDDEHRAQAVIQLASTLRNLGQADEATRMLRAEVDRTPASPLRDEACAFLALALVSQGAPREAASLALLALAPHLTRYRRSVVHYAEALGEDRG
ncbi:tetratricopeptide repeat protein [Microbacterium yannicii]|uniref:tetratricopeptide repeat protein n=1 Tax=Microbacterium yannicii TaxID=671622 RepID=UPI000309A704|nr:tetratricopeptide repeat protein [Microbacterium yannicii]